MVIPETQSVNQSFTITLAHINKIGQLASKYEIKKSEVVRIAIDRLYEAEFGKDTATTADAAEVD